MWSPSQATGDVFGDRTALLEGDEAGVLLGLVLGVLEDTPCAAALERAGRLVFDDHGPMDRINETLGPVGGPGQGQVEGVLAPSHTEGRGSLTEPRFGDRAQAGLMGSGRGRLGDLGRETRREVSGRGQGLPGSDSNHARNVGGSRRRSSGRARNRLPRAGRAITRAPVNTTVPQGWPEYDRGATRACWSAARRRRPFEHVVPSRRPAADDQSSEPSGHLTRVVQVGMCQSRCGHRARSGRRSRTSRWARKEPRAVGSLCLARPRIQG